MRAAVLAIAALAAVAHGTLRRSSSSALRAGEAQHLDPTLLSEAFANAIPTLDTKWVKYAKALAASVRMETKPFRPDVCLQSKFFDDVPIVPSSGILFAVPTGVVDMIDAFAVELTIASPQHETPCPHLVVGVGSLPIMNPRTQLQGLGSLRPFRPWAPNNTYITLATIRDQLGDGVTSLVGQPDIRIPGHLADLSDNLIDAVQHIDVFQRATAAGTPVLFVGVYASGAVAEVAALALAELRGSGEGIQALSVDAPVYMKRPKTFEGAVAPLKGPAADVFITHLMRENLAHVIPSWTSASSTKLFPSTNTWQINAVGRFYRIQHEVQGTKVDFQIDNSLAGLSISSCNSLEPWPLSMESLRQQAPQTAMEPMFDAIATFREKLKESEKADAEFEAEAPAGDEGSGSDSAEDAAAAEKKAEEEKKKEEKEAALRERRKVLNAARSARDARVAAREEAEAAAKLTLAGRQALGSTGSAVGSGEPAPALRNRLITDARTARLGRDALPKGSGGARSGLERGADGDPVWQETGALAGNGAGQQAMSVADAARILADRDDASALRALRLAEEGFTPHAPLQLPEDVKARLHPALYRETTAVVGAGEDVEERTVGELDLPGYLSDPPGSFERTVAEAQAKAAARADEIANGVDPATLTPTGESAADPMDGVRTGTPTPFLERQQRAAAAQENLLNPEEAARQREEKRTSDAALASAPGSGGRNAVPGGGAW